MVKGLCYGHDLPTRYAALCVCVCDMQATWQYWGEVVVDLHTFSTVCMRSDIHTSYCYGGGVAESRPHYRFTVATMAFIRVHINVYRISNISLILYHLSFLCIYNIV